MAKTKYPYVDFRLSLDGDRIYASGGVHLPVGVTDKTIKKAAALFRKVREEFQADLQEAMAPTEGWFWTDEVVHRLSFDDIVKLMTPDEARQVPFPIQKEFAGVDTTGKTLGQVLEMDAGLVSWYAIDTCQPDQRDKQPPARKRAIAAAHVLLIDYAQRERVQVEGEKDF